MRNPKKILGYLAEKGLSNCYRISEECGIDDHRTREWLRELERIGFVERSFEEKSEKGGRRKPYFLTIYGLAVVLEDEKLWRHLDNIIQKHIDLAPCVFSSWELFKELGLDLEAKKRLKQMFQKEGVFLFRASPTSASDMALIAKDYPYRMYDQWLFIWALSSLEGGSMGPNLFSWFFFIPMLHPKTEFSRQKWLQALKGDPSLREWMIGMLNLQVTQHQDEAKTYRDLLHELDAGLD